MIGLIYARVSTPGQREEGTSLDTQVEASLKVAKDREIDIPSEFVLREQASGADSNRPLLARVIELAREGRIDVVIIYHPDRLSRDAIALMVLCEELAELGVELLFVHGPSGTSPEDKLVRFILGYKSEAERRDTMERTNRGKIKTASNGKLPVGAGRGLYGYRYKWITEEEAGKPKLAGREIIPEEARVVEQGFDLCISGICDYEIARKLNQQGVPSKSGGKWHPLTVRRMLTNSGYMGVTYYGKERVQKVKNSTKRVRTPRDESEWIPVPGFTPPIISEATFDLAQRKRKEPKSRPGKAIEPYLLSGHLLCGYCNTPMVGTTMNRKYRYYRCRATYHTATGPKQCSAPYIPYAKLEAAVWDTTARVLEQPDVVLAEMRRLTDTQKSPIEDDVARLKREIKRCKEQESRLVRLYQFGEIDDALIKEQSAPLKLRREDYEAEMEKLTSQQLTMAELEHMKGRAAEYCRRMRQNLDSFGFEEKRMALKALKIKAMVTTTEVQVKGVLGVEADLATTARTSA